MVFCGAGDSIYSMFMDLTNAPCVVSNDLMMAWIAYVAFFVSGFRWDDLGP